jgi:hypothetical protein
MAVIDTSAAAIQRVTLQPSSIIDVLPALPRQPIDAALS